MQAQHSADDASKEQRLVAIRDKRRGLLQQELGTVRKAVRRRLREVEGPRMRSNIQHKVPPDERMFHQLMWLWAKQSLQTDKP
jgi:hypothetical protein